MWVRMCAIAWVVSWGCCFQAQGSALKLYMKEVQRSYKKGEQLAQRKQYKEATAFFLQALRWLRKAKGAATSSQMKARFGRSEGAFYYVIARNYLSAGQCAKAIAYFGRTLSSGASAAIKAQVGEHLERAKAHRRCRATLLLRTTPPHSQVVLRRGDKTHQLTSPLRLTLAPGRWQLQITHKGHKAQRRSLRLRAQKTTSAHIRLRATTRPPPRWIGWVALAAGVLLVGGGIAATAWAGSEFAEVQKRAGNPQLYSSTSQAFSELSARRDGGVAALGTGATLLGVGALSAAFAAWWLLRPSPGQGGPS